MHVQVNITFISLVLCLFIPNILCNNIDVKTSSGVVRGLSINLLNQTLNQFLGIPYAEPPVGSLRFAKPKFISKLIEGIIDATKAKNSCLPSGRLGMSRGLKTSEDCLVLNIWSPQPSGALKPVMFWIHGGGLQSGSIFQFLYNGSVLATNDIVFVSANYRLGHFGFLYAGEESAPGNVGLYDQMLALKWVRENIHLFGGDKNQITVFGESAGSRSISAMVISPESKGLFKRAIMQSGAILHNNKRGMKTKEEVLQHYKQFAKHLNCTDDKQWLECLRKADASLINSIESSLTFPLEGTDFLPNSVQTAFSSSKYLQDIDLLAGVVKNEGSLLAYLLFPRLQQKSPPLTIQDFKLMVNELNSVYHELNVEDVKNYFLKNMNSNDSDVLRQAIYELFGDLHVKCPTYLFTKQFAKQTPKARTFFYELSFQTKNIAKMGCDPKRMGICHGADIEFVFGLPIQYPDKYTKEEADFSKELMKYWTSFAKTGIPDSNWTRIIDVDGIAEIKLLNPMFKNVHLLDPYKNSCDGFWKKYFN